NQDPGDAGALARLGILHARLQRPDQALNELEQAVEKDPTQLEARAELGFLYLRNSETDRAFKAIGDVLADDPRNPLALHYFGMVLYRKGDAARAEEIFKKSAQLDPTFSAPHFSLGELYEAQKKLDDARREYE